MIKAHDCFVIVKTQEELTEFLAFCVDRSDIHLPPLEFFTFIEGKYLLIFIDDLHTGAYVKFNYTIEKSEAIFDNRHFSLRDFERNLPIFPEVDDSTREVGTFQCKFCKENFMEHFEGDAEGFCDYNCGRSYINLRAQRRSVTEPRVNFLDTPDPTPITTTISIESDDYCVSLDSKGELSINSDLLGEISAEFHLDEMLAEITEIKKSIKTLISYNFLIR